VQLESGKTLKIRNFSLHLSAFELTFALLHRRSCSS
jgi:hypothetical protein